MPVHPMGQTNPGTDRTLSSVVEDNSKLVWIADGCLPLPLQSWINLLRSHAL
jgi:hypothetical protein